MGGRPTGINQYPWLARLVYDGQFHCGASLLTPGKYSSLFIIQKYSNYNLIMLIFQIMCLQPHIVLEGKFLGKI